MKTCVKCREEKPLDDFHRQSHLPDGRHPYCKVCRNKRAAEYEKDRYYNEPEYVEAKRSRHKKRYQTDPAYRYACNMASRRWAENNREAYLESQRRSARKRKMKRAGESPAP